MPSPSVTYTLTNGTTADATQVMQNFTDILNAMSDGTKDFSIAALTVAGTATLNGHVNLGNSSADDLTITASLAATLPIKTNTSYDIGGSTTGLRSAYFGGTSTFTGQVKAATLAASRVWTVPDTGADASFVMTQGTQTVAGTTTFSAKTLFSNGSVSAPSVGFSSDDDGSGTGFYRVGANSLGFAANGVDVGLYTSAGAWRLGPSAGGSGVNSSTLSQFKVGVDDADSSGSFFMIARRSSGTKVAYLVAGLSSECGLSFQGRDSGGSIFEAGAFDSNGAWTIGKSGASQLHTLHGQTNASAPGAVSTYLRLSVNGTTYKIALLGNT